MDEGQSSMMEAQLANLTAMKDIPQICVRHYRKGKLTPSFQIREGMIHTQLPIMRDGETTPISDIKTEPHLPDSSSKILDNIIRHSNSPAIKILVLKLRPMPCLNK
ncbi:hypothetical protein GOBAR_DD17234 [Gossypium barbadense]|nr:hypothetical protein GOBAR_DD17234 [Gossypium barbadense]